MLNIKVACSSWWIAERGFDWIEGFYGGGKLAKF